MKNKNVFKIVKDIHSLNDIYELSKLPKTKNILGYYQNKNIINIEYASPSFFQYTNKIVCNFFLPHYANFKGPFVTGCVESGKLISSKGFVAQTHTSVNFDKINYSYGQQKMTIDHLVIEYNNGFINTTLIPTNQKHLFSYGFQGKNFIAISDLHDNHFSILKSDVRIGDQVELNKINTNLNLKFKTNDSILKGFNSKYYYLKDDTFENFLINNGIIYDQKDLDLITSIDDANKNLYVEACSFEYALKNKKLFDSCTVNLNDKNIDINGNKIIYIDNTLFNDHSYFLTTSLNSTELKNKIIEGKGIWNIDYIINNNNKIVSGKRIDIFIDDKEADELYEFERASLIYQSMEENVDTNTNESNEDIDDT